ncbi:MAG: hypothetical protein A3K19_23740 [Lentisphaerae bacterium RIFOXYB12_FULL_65_16]|nr:MAG: hypothetical protein A3K18_16615 [Lentisphaerae bacterium RIFOXYA12_64_32]OGV89449.1 MAG: hypothetical protein A3K19_23740 [Lentisphaerae bacterium RIFOXYB12_FULL_65_16]
MDPNEKKLSELLRQWPGREPSPTFEQDVLRRIRLDRAQPDAGLDAPGIWGWLPAWLAAPRRAAFAAGCTLVLAFAVGVVGAMVVPAGSDARAIPGTTPFSLLAPGTVAGDYLAMTGGQRQ